MKDLLIGGCYDQITLETLLSLGVSRFAFDLRGRSTNLVPYHQLREFTKKLVGKEVVLIFENDKISTVNSFLDLLKDSGPTFVLEFRDNQDLKYYESFRCPFYWPFTPESDWKKILDAPDLAGVLIPLEFKKYLQELPDFWLTIEARNIEILLHVEGLELAESLSHYEHLTLSIDLNRDIETTYRCVDQQRLRSMKLWRKLSENSAH